MMFLFAKLTKEIIFRLYDFSFIYTMNDLCMDADICPSLRYEYSHKICQITLFAPVFNIFIFAKQIQP